MLVLDPKNPVGCHFLLALPPGLMPLQYDLVWDRLATILDGYGLEAGGAIPSEGNPDFNLWIQRNDDRSMQRFELDALLAFQAQLCEEFAMTGLEVPCRTTPATVVHIGG